MGTKLTKNFSLEEMTKSDTARAKGVSNIPTAKEVENLRRLCVEILQPLSDSLGLPIYVNSGFRNKATNALVGGVANSAHLSGYAADIICPAYGNAEKFSRYVANFLKRKGIKFDQVINEYGRWCHVGVANLDGKQRGQLLTYTKNGVRQGI